MRLRRLGLVALFTLSFACGGASRPQVAAAGPEKKASTAPDAPLVPYELKEDADLVRAIREHYTKYEFRIPMRDGKKLFTDAYVPKDRSHPWPIVMARTPYGLTPYGVDNTPGTDNARVLRRFAPSWGMVKEGYVFVHQDVRGRMMSEGDFVDVRPHRTNPSGVDESTDTYDTIEWLLHNVPNNNGKVGIWGISYPGFYAAQSAVDAHPALKAVSPQAPVTDWFNGDDFHHNGALFLADAFQFISSFGKPRPEPVKKWPWEPEHDGLDVYDFFLGVGPISNTQSKYLKNGIPFWNQMFEHGTRDDFWKAMDPRPSYKNAKPAVMTVGGWYDAEDLFGALETYRAFEKQSPGAKNTLVMGPWRHGGWARTDGDALGDIKFGQKTSFFYREKIEQPFFQKYLKGADVPAPPEAYVFETGVNEWRTFDAWPPKDAKPVFLSFRAKGALSSAPLTAADEGDGADSYVSDPQRPVPFRWRMGSSIDADFMTDDQRFAARRPDVLVYQTGAFDTDTAIAGPIEATLWVSTTGTDADFVVKVVDVWPEDAADPTPNPAGIKMGGYQELVRAEIMRGKFRNSLERPEPFKPGEPTLVRFTLPDVLHSFRAGHRLMVQVQSSWFPLADRNPQTFVDIYKATESDFKAQTHRVYHAHERASGIRVLLERGSL
jgi:putative CocE/NonD family hydrolase